MNNYSNYKPDEIPELCCKDCGKHLEDLFVAFEDTEFEQELEICESCFYHKGFTAQII